MNDINNALLNRIHDETADIESFRRVSGADQDRSGRGITCPTCTSGQGQHGTGPTMNRQRPGRVYCVHCGNMDAVDVIVEREQCEWTDALHRAADRLGIPHDAGSSSHRYTAPGQTLQAAPQHAKDRAPLPDYTEFIKGAQAALIVGSPGAAYLESRGLRLDIARAAGIGFDPAWRHPKVPNSVPLSPRIIVPMDTGTYETRDIRPDDELKRMGGEALRYKKQSVQPKGIFNASALQGTDPVHIVEGWADALAVMSAGGRAVSLNSTSGRARLVELIDERKAAGHDVPPLILALDVDENNAGQDAQGVLAAELDARNVSYSTGTICLPDPDNANATLDPADSYRIDPPEFAHRVRQDGKRAAHGYSNDNLRFAGADELKGAFWKDFITIVKGGTPRTPTGIECIDKQLGGGMFSGLFVLGGRTGSGKTTLALQIADSIAAQGRPVLYVALEMSKFELQAKSLARLAYDIATERKEPILNYAQIMEGALSRKTWSADPLARLYRDTIALNMIVYEAVGNTPADVVRQKAEIVRKVRGIAPVIVVDYLQIMGTTDPHMTDKQATDANILELKQLSRDLDAPVLAISSMNRAGYRDPNKAVEEADFKESGAIEYTADVLWGLERTDKRGPNARERDVQLRLLKHRRGVLRKPAGFVFRPGPCLFNPHDEAAKTDDQAVPELREPAVDPWDGEQHSLDGTAKPTAQQEMAKKKGLKPKGGNVRKPLNFGN